MKTPHLIEGGIFHDARGSLRFVNDFSLKDIKRFYITENADTQMVRAWQGHRVEAKFFMAIAGKIDIALVPIDHWEAPSPDLEVHHFYLDADNPAVLAVPPGYANGFRMQTPGARLLVFSVSTLADAEHISFPLETWKF